jgi:hypothetical protein
VTAGIAFTYSDVSGDYARQGGDFDTESMGGLIYATFLPLPQLFVDLVGGYARKHYTTNRAISSATSIGPGSTSATILASTG